LRFVFRGSDNPVAAIEAGKLGRKMEELQFGEALEIGVGGNDATSSMVCKSGEIAVRPKMMRKIRSQRHRHEWGIDFRRIFNKGDIGFVAIAMVELRFGWHGLLRLLQAMHSAVSCCGQEPMSFPPPDEWRQAADCDGAFLSQSYFVFRLSRTEYIQRSIASALCPVGPPGFLLRGRKEVIGKISRCSHIRTKT
jgi:hypothetical protein